MIVTFRIHPEMLVYIQLDKKKTQDINSRTFYA